ncbi:hypothetical protein [Haloarchaeobius amylolyticus]|uniref:hypothetical protein n=1 Tax=Haloarchaeobius amylolyticus TaxID=1198296 RepID=UPI002271AC19|nr:hypothetical protein [Haloarchaeobius amylolyticus]
MTAVETIERVRVFVLLLLAMASFGFVLSQVVPEGWLVVPVTIGLSFGTVFVWERRRLRTMPELVRPMTPEERLEYVETTLDSWTTFVWLVVLFVAYTLVLMTVTIQGVLVFGGALVLSFGTVFFWIRRQVGPASVEG